MTTVYEIPLQFWIGSTDVNGMLSEIGGWHVGSYAALAAAEAVEYAIKRGLVQQRTHYFPNGKTAAAYEVTDDGLTRLERSWGPKVRAQAEAARKWYRNRTPQSVTD